jgi:hypothetical protein
MVSSKNNRLFPSHMMRCVHESIAAVVSSTSLQTIFPSHTSHHVILPLQLKQYNTLVHAPHHLTAATKHRVPCCNMPTHNHKYPARHSVDARNWKPLPSCSTALPDSRSRSIRSRSLSTMMFLFTSCSALGVRSSLSSSAVSDCCVAGRGLSCR